MPINIHAKWESYETVDGRSCAEIKVQDPKNRNEFYSAIIVHVHEFDVYGWTVQKIVETDDTDEKNSTWQTLEDGEADTEDAAKEESLRRLCDFMNGLKGRLHMIEGLSEIQQTLKFH